MSSKTAAVFCAWTALGIWGMAPSVSFGDSGEFIAAAAALGIAHAPGYPLPALVGHAAGILLPWARWAYAVNLASVLAGAAAAALLFAALRRGPGGEAGALLGCACAALTPLWLHTTLQAEVFALHLTAACALLWVYYRFAGDLLAPRPAAAAGLILGLGGANHHTLILIVPALLLGTWAERGFHARRWARGLAWLFGCGLLGLALYAYLPIRARVFPPLDWGHPVDLPRFWHVLLRKDYGSFALTIEGQTGGGVWAQSARFVRAAAAGLGAVGSGAALLGAAAAARERGRTWVMPAAWILCAGPCFLWLGDPPFDAQTAYALERFYLLPWLGAAVFAARLPLWLPARPRRWAPALALLPLGWSLAHAGQWHQRWDLAAADYGRNLLRSLPRAAALFLDGGDDSFYTTAYWTIAEGLRPDVAVHDRGGLVFANPYGADFRRLGKEAKEERRLQVEAAFARRRPLYYATLKRRLLPGHRLEARGLLRESVPETLPPRRSDLWRLYPLRFDDALARAHYRYRALTPVYAAMRAEAEPPARALAYLALAAAQGPDVRWLPPLVAHRAQHLGFKASGAERWPLAERAYALAWSQDHADVASLLNVGVALEKQGRFAEAEARYRDGMRRDPASYQARFNLGALLWRRARFGEAAAAFEQALARKPGDAAAATFAARARARSER